MVTAWDVLVGQPVAAVVDMRKPAATEEALIRAKVVNAWLVAYAGTRGKREAPHSAEEGAATVPAFGVS